MKGARLLKPSYVALAVLGTKNRLTTFAGRRILKNAAALSVAQVASYLLPMILLPYMAVTLGPKGFGLIALTQAVAQYSTLITNYGFSYSATRQAAVCRENSRDLAELVVNVWAAKCVLMLACLLASLAAFALVPSLRPAAVAYLFAFITVIGNVLYLDWFFQAIEEMKWITIVTVVPKLLFIPFIFVFVKQPSDYPLVLLIQSAAFLASGLLAAVLARRHLDVELPRPSFSGLTAQLKDGWHTFLSTVSINLYTSTNTVLLGVMTTSTVVGYYSAGQKVVLGVQALWAPFSQALYPHFCRSFDAAPDRAGRQLGQLAVGVLGVTLIVACAVSLAAPHFVPQYLGARFSSSVGVIRILVFVVAAIATSNVLGVHGMLAAGLNHDFLRVVALSAALNLALAPCGIALGGHIGLAASVVAVEYFVMISMYLRLRRRHVLV